MHADLEKLLQLDVIDRELGQLRSRIDALPRRLAEIEAKLAGANAEVEKARQAIKDIETARRKQESDIQSLQQKISKYREQMLTVKTNQEYKALGNQIEFSEQEIRLIEDRILDGMFDLETREKQLKAAEAERKTQQAIIEKEKAEAREVTAQHEKRLAELSPGREALRKGVTPETLRHYDRVLKTRGSAIAEVRDQCCQACHVIVRPQAYNDILLSEKVLTCDSCGRILYINPDNAAAPQGSSDRKETVETAATQTTSH
jgi:predicted  nucleic acid-binding Zn-ribbon protein